jgi:hypothetical protein
MLQYMASPGSCTLGPEASETRGRRTRSLKSALERTPPRARASISFATAGSSAADPLPPASGKTQMIHQQYNDKASGRLLHSWQDSRQCTGSAEVAT